MALFVEFPVEKSTSGPAAVALDPGGGVQVLSDEAAQRVGILASIGDDMAHAGQVGDQPLSLRAVAPMAGRQREPDRQAERIHRCMVPDPQPAAGPANRA